MRTNTEAGTLGSSRARARMSSLLLVLLAGCAAPTDDESYDVASTAQPLWSVTNEQYWPDGVVPTCYKNGGGFGSSYLTTYAMAARDIVEAEMESLPNTAIDFTGWELCPSTLPDGMYRFVLNRGSGGGSSSTGYQETDAHTFASSEQDLGVRWDSYVLHELTHVLGFKHEFDRADAPIHVGPYPEYDCLPGPSPDADADNERRLTIYDPDSVANQTYCVRARTGHLSELDKLGLEIAYYDGDGTQGVRGRHSLTIAGGVVIRSTDEVVFDWRQRGAADGAFSGDPVWTVGGTTFAGLDYPSSRLTKGVLTTVRAEFEDFRGRSHLATGKVKLDTGLHTALVMTSQIVTL